MSRVISADIANLKAKEEGLEVKGAVMASDAFFPFRDGIDKAAASGIAAIIQPGGSIRDDEVIAAADENDPQTSDMVKNLMKSIFTSCKALGHTPEAAQFARRCCFSMQDYFGLNSVFITITPDDENNFRIKLLTRPGEEVSFIDVIFNWMKNY